MRTLKAVTEYLLPIYQADFEDHKQDIIRWMPLDEGKQKEYLTKLKTQVDIAIRVLQTPESLDAQHAKKLKRLWRCIKLKNVADFFNGKENPEQGSLKTPWVATTVDMEIKLPKLGQSIKCHYPGRLPVHIE